MDDRKVVFLSPSTQEWNVGVGDFGTEEQRMNEIADSLENILKRRGYIVYRNNPDETLQQAVAKSNEIGPDIHVAIHSNASGSSGKGRGPEIYANRPDTSGARLAQDIYDQIEKIYPYPELGRGVLYTDKLYEIIRTLAPAVLLEVAFHDNEEDANWIINNIDNIAQAIADGIENYFNGQGNLIILQKYYKLPYSSI